MPIIEDGGMGGGRGPTRTGRGGIKLGGPSIQKEPKFGRRQMPYAPPGMKLPPVYPYGRQTGPTPMERKRDRLERAEGLEPGRRVTRTPDRGLTPGPPPGRAVETLTPARAVEMLAGRGAGLNYPSPYEFNERLRGIMREKFPLEPWARDYLNRVQFQFMRGEPGWASSAELGAAFDPQTVVHEYLHNFPAPALRASTGIAQYDPNQFVRERLQRAFADPNVMYQLGLRNPENIEQVREELRSSPWHGFTAPLELATRMPEGLRVGAYPFLPPGVSPRRYLGRPEGPQGGFAWPELVYTDVAQNPERYREIFEQDPGFWYGVFLPRLQRTLMTQAFER